MAEYYTPSKMIPCERTKEQWEAVKPQAVIEGSAAQAGNVLAMAIQDIMRLHARNEVMAKALEAAEQVIEQSISMGHDTDGSLLQAHYQIDIAKRK